ncbi:MAG: T9SS type A sorting domain-containing protein [Bacteroidota bacterium]
MKKNIYISFFIVSAFVISGFQAVAMKHLIHVGSYYFTPNSLNVNVGDTIRWVWDNGSHTTTSTTIPAGASTWDSPMTSSVQTFEYPVAIAGLYNYKCTPHAAMGQVATFTASAVSPSLMVTPSNRNVTSAAGSTTFTITSNSAWTTSCDRSWCIATGSGTGNGIIISDYDENTTVFQRTATITVTVSGIPSQLVTVTQSGAAPILSVSPANQNVTATAGNTTFDVVSNTNWSAQSSAVWCTVTSSGIENGNIVANFDANTANVARIAAITITVSGLPPILVTVSQEGSTVGIQEDLLKNIQICPNPTTGIFKVNCGSTGDLPMEVTIMDMNGKTVFQRSCAGSATYDFDLTQSSKGYYFIRFKTANVSSVKKIIFIDDSL